MTNPLQVYNENFGYSHEAAVQAVYNAGVSDAQAPAPKPVPEVIEASVSSEALVNVNAP
jgi:hypothetical protein